MKTIFFTLSLGILFPLYCMSQAEENYSREFGKVTNYEMTVTEYPGDPDAEAFYIYELGDYSFSPDYNSGFLLHHQYQFKIKILSQAGLDYATIEIPLYFNSTETEHIESLQAITYNAEDGRLLRSELEMKNVYEEKTGGNWLVKKFAMPDVKVGSVIEVRYKLVSPFLFAMRPWYFQYNIPVKYSLLKCRLIPYYEYAYILRGAGKFDIHDRKDLTNDIQFRNLNYREREISFGMENVPAFRDEDFISSRNNYIISLDFQLAAIHKPNGGVQQILSTWPELRKDFMKHEKFGKYIIASRKEAKKILKNFPAAGISDREKAEVLTQYIKMLYNWNGRYGKLSTQKVGEFIKNKTGNAGDINLFLTALLQEAGLECYPVVLSTRSNGTLYKSYPFESMLNYVVAMVEIEGEEYHLDATESLYSFDHLPTRCIHVEGLVVNQDKEDRWTYLEDKYVTIIKNTLSMTIDPETTSAQIKVDIEADGHAGVRFRARNLGGEEKLAEYIQERYKLDRITDLETEGMEEVDKPFTVRFAYESALEGGGDKLFISPFAGLPIKDNPFKQEKRVLPVDLLYVAEEYFISEISIPEGYKVVSIPQDRVSTSPSLDISYEVKQEGNKLFIKGGFAFKSSLYLPQFYEPLKHRMAAILDRLSDRVVLEKEM